MRYYDLGSHINIIMISLLFRLSFTSSARNL